MILLINLLNNNGILMFFNCKRLSTVYKTELQTPDGFITNRFDLVQLKNVCRI